MVKTGGSKTVLRLLTTETSRDLLAEIVGERQIDPRVRTTVQVGEEKENCEGFT